MQTEYTSNDVRYKWDLAGPNGASFIIFQDDKSDDDVKKAIREIKNERDVVCLRKANRYDLLDDYWTKVFVCAEKKYKLNWQQIERDDIELSKAMTSGKTPEEYVDTKWELWKQ